MEYVGILLIVLCSLLNSSGHYLFKTSLPAGGSGPERSPWRSGKLWAGLGIFAVTTLISVYAFHFGDLTVLGPLTNLVLVWNLILAHRFLGDRIGLRRVAATGLILAGCIVVTL